MTVRLKNKLNITMCIPFFAQEILNSDIYYDRKSKIYDELKLLIENFLNGKYDFELSINTQDDIIRNTIKGVGHYFVISGSALDSGEEGVVGRGNRSRGVISNIRPVSMEAVCGKNPVYYVGKVYTYLADLLAKKISEIFECECTFYISSRNSDPLSTPYNVYVETTKKINQKKVMKIISEEFDKGMWYKEIIKNKVFLPLPGGGNGYSSLSL